MARETTHKTHTHSSTNALSHTQLSRIDALKLSIHYIHCSIIMLSLDPTIYISVISPAAVVTLRREPFSPTGIGLKHMKQRIVRKVILAGLVHTKNPDTKLRIDELDDRESHPSRDTHIVISLIITATDEVYLWG